ncbi:MAG: GNAT family N-acetyltransferase [Candidatus Methylomirabilales bacterium]
MDITRLDRLTCIRFATEKDLERIVAIDRLSFSRQWDYCDFKAALNDVFLVFEKTEILGYLIGCCWQMEKKAILLRMAVHPEHRHKGIGTMLLEFALESLATMNILEVELNVEVVKPGVVRLCENVGFKVTTVVAANHEENDEVYVMKLRLNTQSHAA